MNLLTLKAPCKDCANRDVGCHGRCGKYKIYKIGRMLYLKKRKITISAMQWSRSAEEYDRRKLLLGKIGWKL